MTAKGDGFSILFDMNELFDEYIGRAAVNVFSQRGLAVRLQGPTRHLATSDRGALAFDLRPDIVISICAGPAVIIDTKWKRLQAEAAREAVFAADMYQMLPYGHRNESPDVILLYPHHGGLQQWPARRATYSVGRVIQKSSGCVIQVSVATVDLVDLATVSAQLLQICAARDLAAA